MYTINPDDTTPFQAYCSGGWTVFQRRVDDTVDFYRGWDEYVTGFGDLTGNLWEGLDKIHAMAGNALYNTQLHVYMESFEDESREVMYSSFTVADASTGYLMTVSGYSGDAGDSMGYHNGMRFSTNDRDQDLGANTNCGQRHNGGWWYNLCAHTNPNGRYSYSNVDSDYNIYWFHWKGSTYPLKTIQLKIRRI